MFQILSDLMQSKSEPLLAPYRFVRKLAYGSNRNYNSTLWQMQKRGIIKVINKNSKKFIQITKKGELQVLLAKTKIDRPAQWDGKWRLIVFDIPESSREKRSQLRFLLKKNDFYKLQASVFISPYPLNREAVVYLKQTGLIGYIRLMRIDDIDDDAELKKKFKL